MAVQIKLDDDRFLELSIDDDADDDAVALDVEDLEDRPAPDPEPEDEAERGLLRLLFVGALVVLGAAAVRALAGEGFEEPEFDDTPTEVTVEN